jgi:heme exporter protein D
MPAQAPVDAAGEAEFLWMAVLLSLLPLLLLQKKKSLGSFSVLLSRS